MYDYNKVLEVARAEIGYHEKASNKNLDDKTANAGDKNYTKYARDLDALGFYNGRKQSYAYCDVFADWCYYKAYGYEAMAKLTNQPAGSKSNYGAGCTYSRRYYKNMGRLFDYPEPGDQIFFYQGGDIGNNNAIAHTGIVEAVDKTYVYTIEGNTSNKVARRKYKLTDSKIAGYGRPRWECDGVPAETVPETPKDPEELSRGDKGSKVKAMQTLLLRWDPSCLPQYGADADFGTETYKALKAFQKTSGLTVSGIYDAATRKALADAKPVTPVPEPTPEPTPEPVTGYREATTTAEPERIWDFLMREIGNPFGVAAMMGNMKAESALRSMNLQNTYETKLGMTDTTYTKAVDNGSYSNFAGDSAGYGVCQWTSAGRKANLLKHAKATNSSIGNLTMQLEFLMQELRGGYKSTLTVLQAAKTVREASDVVLTKFERPANQSESVKLKRASYGEEYHKTYATGSVPETPATETALRKGSKGADVEQLQRYLIEAGYSLPKYGVDGDYGSETEKAVKAFQLDNGLPGSGICDDKTRDVLMTRVGVRVVVVLGGTVNTRTAPINGTVYKVVKKGDKLPYLQTDANTGWYLVMVDGVAVWITPKPEYTKIAQA